MLTLPFIFSALAAGVLMFLAPCTLPLVPAYLGFLSGVDIESTQTTDLSSRKRKRIFFNGLAFVLGFSFIFVLFGTLAGLLGQALAPWRIWLTRIGGILIIFFGLYTLGLFNIPLFSGGSLPTPSWLQPGDPKSAGLAGAAFAFGWSPCVGPVLGSILALASSSTTALQGGLLLAVFSVGLAIPFLLTALLYGRASQYIEDISEFAVLISKIGGIFLVGLGLLLVFDKFSLTIQYGYELFDFIEYDALQQYL